MNVPFFSWKKEVVSCQNDWELRPSTTPFLHDLRAGLALKGTELFGAQLVLSPTRVQQPVVALTSTLLSSIAALWSPQKANMFSVTWTWCQCGAWENQSLVVGFCKQEIIRVLCKEGFLGFLGFLGSLKARGKKGNCLLGQEGFMV